MSERVSAPVGVNAPSAVTPAPTVAATPFQWGDAQLHLGDSLERTAAARARGRLGNRPRALTPEKLSTDQALMRDPSISVSQVCRTVGVSRRTLYRHLMPDGTLRTGGAA